MHGDKRRLDELFLDKLIEALVKCVTPGGFDLVHIDASGLRGGDSLGIIGYSHKVDTDVFLDSLGHGQALPAGGEVDLAALPCALIGAEYLNRSARQEVFKQIHHVVKIGVGLIELNGRELGVVLRVHALIAEDAADLVDALNAADYKALEVELGCDAQEHVDIQRVVMGYERTRCCAAGNGVKYGRFDLHKASAVEEGADIAYELRADLEVAAAVVAHDEVDIALAVFELGARHAVEFLRQRAQAL